MPKLTKRKSIKKFNLNKPNKVYRIGGILIESKPSAVSGSDDNQSTDNSVEILRNAVLKGIFE